MEGEVYPVLEKLLPECGSPGRGIYKPQSKNQTIPAALPVPPLGAIQPFWSNNIQGCQL